MMNLERERGQSVLVVDDDHISLSYFCSTLSLKQYKVVTAKSAEAAQRILDREGADQFDCVLTDFQMPRRSGLDLLSWLRKRDASLSTILITGRGEKELVKESLRAGVADFLEKPINHEDLSVAVERAIARTRHERDRDASHRGLREARKVPHIFYGTLAEGLRDRIKVVCSQRQQVGGDFALAVGCNEGRYVAVVGDISGHDVRAAFMSAHFQGVIRTLLMEGHGIDDVANRVNAILCRDWNSAVGENAIAVPVSISLTLCDVDAERGKVTVLNCGAPHSLAVYGDGNVERLDNMHSPLGWYDDEAFTPTVYPITGIEHILIHTDGIDAAAAQEHVVSNALLYKMMSTDDEKAYQMSDSPPDDLLAMRIKIDTEVTDNPDWNPIINEQYSGDEIRDIDKAQNIWRRSLRFALEEELGDRLYDVITCVREAMINAFTHGCDKEPDRTCSLQINYNQKSKLLRVRVDDSGPGHNFDAKKRLKELDGTVGERLGLGLIEAMSDSTRVENNGTSITFEFILN